MNEIDVLKTIADHLSERKRFAALSNYKVLCNTIRQANELLNSGVEAVKSFHAEVEALLKADENVTDDAKTDTTALYYFRRIVPVILANDIHILQKFADSTRADDRQGITIESLDKLRRGFIDYNNLATTTRSIRPASHASLGSNACSRMTAVILIVRMPEAGTPISCSW